MNAQRDEILDQIAKHGWDALLLEEYDREWWADEMWLLISKWSPVGSRAYLTFLVDPMFGTHDRKKGESVWAVMASSEKPTRQQQWPRDSFELSLKQEWKERLPELLEHLSDWRNKQRTEEIDGS